jgi:hypothetical protein
VFKELDAGYGTPRIIYPSAAGVRYDEPTLPPRKN